MSSVTNPARRHTEHHYESAHQKVGEPSHCESHIHRHASYTRDDSEHEEEPRPLLGPRPRSVKASYCSGKVTSLTVMLTSVTSSPVRLSMRFIKFSRRASVTWWMGLP